MPLTAQFLEPYVRRIFVETGTLTGDGVTSALNAGFCQVRTIELSKELYWNAHKRFEHDPRVRCVNGDSGVALAELITDIAEPVTFWLDGHWSGDGTARGPEDSPVVKELAQIKAHPINKHIILIDDVRIMGSSFGASLGTLCELLWNINKDYSLTLETGHLVFPHDVLVAKLRV